MTGILEQAIRSSFNFLRREARAEAGVRLSRLYSVTGRYSLQRTRIFDEHITDPEQQPLIDRLFPQVRLSTFAGSLIRDSRDDVLDTAKGTLVVVESDVAARAIGSEVGLRQVLRPGAHVLPAAVGAPHRRRAGGAPRRRARLSARSRRAWTPTASRCSTTTARRSWTSCRTCPASERFFAGGDTTVRGFALDRLGDESTISDTGFPTGGNGVIVLNGELRVAVIGRIQGVGFLDAGNVVARASDLESLRPAPRGGLRRPHPLAGRAHPPRPRVQARSPRALARPARAAQHLAHLAGAGLLMRASRRAARCVPRRSWPSWPDRSAAQTLLDRVVARVNGSVILLSDVRAAVAARADRGARPTPRTRWSRWCSARCSSKRSTAFRRRSRRPRRSTPSWRGCATRAGGSLDAVERATGLTADQVRLLARDRLRIQVYIDQRFGVTVPLTDEQVLQVPTATTPTSSRAGGQVVPFERAQGLARERAGLEQRQRTISQWLGDLRGRADVSLPAR